MTTWLDPQPVEVPDALQQATGGPGLVGRQLVGRTLVRRGIRSPIEARAFLDADFYVPAPATNLPDLATAAGRLRQAIERQEMVVIWGDFDADGQTSTALLLETLRVLGAQVTYRVPTRQEGHGLHWKGMERLIRDGAQIILTCDTGVTAHDAVTLANQRGVEVIITDHHVLGDALPPALAVVNPHCLPPGHPMEALTGVGVAYQLARALDADVAARTLDLVALGTVADVGTLTADNRYLVQLGLEALRGTARPGLQAIYDHAELRPEGLTEEHIGFVLGPRLNALGRLADARSGVELLTTDDITLARTLASEVEGLNIKRQQLTRDVMAGALAQIERDPSLLTDYHALVLSHEQWPGGIVGIVAGKLAERFHKPAVLISAPEKSGKLARGSGRSVPGADLAAALTACAGLLGRHGGHPGAAGFSIDPARIDEFRDAFSRAIAQSSDAISEPVLEIDAYVELPELTMDLVQEISRLAPFGPGNPPLTLAVRDLKLASQATIGRTKEHLRLTVEDSQDNTQTVFWWQGADQPLPTGLFDLALTVRASDYRGMAEVQVEWIDARLHEPEELEIEAAPRFEIRDYREERDPEELLAGLIQGGEVQVWAEGLRPLTGVKARTRIQLEPCPQLIVWTAPPGPREWQEALDWAQPDEVIVFAREAGTDERRVFLHALGILGNRAIEDLEGVFPLERAAARLGHRVGTVCAGLDYLEASGTLSVVERGRDAWLVREGTDEPDALLVERMRAKLDEYLYETAAYRGSFRKTPAESLARRATLRKQV